MIWPYSHHNHLISMDSWNISPESIYDWISLWICFGCSWIPLKWRLLPPLSSPKQICLAFSCIGVTAFSIVSQRNERRPREPRRGKCNREDGLNRKEKYLVCKFFCCRLNRNLLSWRPVACRLERWLVSRPDGLFRSFRGIGGRGLGWEGCRSWSREKWFQLWSWYSSRVSLLGWTPSWVCQVCRVLLLIWDTWGWNRSIPPWAWPQYSSNAPAYVQTFFQTQVSTSW